MPEADIDHTALKNLLASVGHDEAFFQVLVSTYLEDTPEQLAAMQQAVDSADPDQFRRAAHSLKSNSSNFGAHNLAEISKELEEFGRSGTLMGVAPRLIQAEAEFQKVQRELESLLSRGVSSL